MTDYMEPDLDWEREQYRKAGIDFQPYQLWGKGEQAVAETLADTEVLIVNEAPVTRTVLEGMPNCRLVIRHGNGYDNIDTDAATDLGIVVANQPGIWTEEVADQALGFLYYLLLKLPVQIDVAAKVRDGHEEPWRLDRVYPVRRVTENTVGVIGFGRIGKAFVRRVRSLGFPVLVNDPYVDPKTVRELSGTDPAARDEVLARSDAVSLHVPATAETKGMIDAAALETMKPTAVLINTARGAVVITDALVAALESGSIAAAAVDVTDPEPLPSNHRLYELPNAVVTPHLAWYSEDALWQMRRSIVDNVIAFSHGKLPDSVVNPEVLR
jgi:D-3-phosphoglycerate dehydrogenase